MASVGEGDLFTRQLAAGSAVRIAGRNPNMQLTHLDDAAAVLAAALRLAAVAVEPLQWRSAASTELSLPLPLASVARKYVFWVLRRRRYKNQKRIKM